MKTLLNISKINIKLTLILSVLVMLWSLESNASVYGILKGKVLDSDGKPAIGASVRVLGTTRGAQIKNVSGEFTIVNILAGNYELVITSYGNSEMKKTINIIADSTIDIGTLKIKNRAISDEIIENRTIEKYGPAVICYDTYYNIFKKVSFVELYKKELKIIKNNNSCNFVTDVVKFIYLPVSSHNTNMYTLIINEIKTYNPPTAKFGILENLSFTAGVTQ
jgi:hypothetical protein